MQNERKLFQKNAKKAFRERKKANRGITLIALVISIIVMLILAGVSLNAVIGDNGIITQAQNATYMQGIVALEEYLQTEYVKYYDEAEDYTNKIEMLSSKMTNLCLKDGTKNYITYDGKMYYLVNKQSLPDDIKNQLKGGDTTEYAKYIRLQDVYGITTDLRVYYCADGLEGALGTLTDLEIDPNTPLNKINNNAGLKDAITEALSEIGITIGENGITTGNVSNLKTLTLDGTKSNITSLSGISELTVLQELNLKNLTIPNLDGIEACNLLKTMYFDNCQLTEENGYSKLATVLDLQKLYFKFDSTIDEATANKQIEKLGLALSTATSLNKIEYFGIFGTEGMIKERTQFSYDGTSGKYSYNSNTRNNVTNISSLSSFAPNIKASIKYMYLNNNNLNSIEALKDFSNIEEIYVLCNSNLTSLTGLENHTSIKYILAQYTGIVDLIGLSGCSNINTGIFTKTNLQSLDGLSSSSLNQIDAENSKVTDISALNDNTSITYLQLENNSSLQDISSIKNCSNINNLYLAGNTLLDETVLSSLEFQNIIKNCGTNYSLDGKYGLLFLNQERVDLSNSNLTDEQLELLRGKENIKGIKLTGNASLSNSKIEDILSTLKNLECISLVNLSQVSSINFVKELNNLVELDLRGTAVSDLSILENLANENKLSIGSLILDNKDIDVTKIQKTISYVSINGKPTNYTFNEDGSLRTSGIIILNKDVCKLFESCTEIVSFKNYSTVGGVDATIDLSNCINLTEISARGYNAKFIIPNSCKSISLDSTSKTPDLSRCDNLETLNLGYASVNINEILSSLQNARKLSIFSVYRNSVTSKIDELHNLKYTKVTSIDFSNSSLITNINIKEEVNNIVNISLENCKSFETIETFGNLTSLQTLNIIGTKVQSLEPIRNHKALTTLYMNNSNVNSLSALENVTTLTNIESQNTKISSLQGVENLVNLTNLNVSGNSISNLYYLSKLAEKGILKLTTLNIADNLLENNTVISVDGQNINVNNIEIIKSLYDAGLRNIDISGNNFSDTSEIKNLNWDSYKE